jgi:hypothetical protein
MDTTMRQTSGYCDRCGAVIIEAGSVLELLPDPAHGHPHRPLELCQDCGTSFQHWIRLRPELARLNPTAGDCAHCSTFPQAREGAPC